ncbi:hypothetical protein O181_040461 [Austropuccinia psidii MF-1]|uniref:Phosphatidylethanolamine-binding protein n=1 Tax=Austropuccinia psidii MF-1 TaxID=1389203 RepID=A0A9Q3DBE4_9BASI|nr:hypothetical protein [Austropuccinia psidii MF-1]
MFPFEGPIIPYTSPQPAKGTLTHEYIILIVPQINQKTTQQLFNNRNRWLPLSDLSKFQVTNQVIAGNFFKSTYAGK